MGLFSKFFSSPKVPTSGNKPEVQFGRYTDRNKSPEQLESWTQSVDFFKEKKYLESYNKFFEYLKDPKVDNVKFTKHEDRIEFEFIQGSKIVKGVANETELFAEAEVVIFDKPNVAVMRKLLTENFYLWFTKFTIRDNMFTIRHLTPSQAAHPTSVYFSLKELANVADSFDDVLVDEFPFLLPVNVSHIQPISETEKKIKLKYFRDSINQAINRLKELDTDHFSAARSFIILNLTYKLYYLLAPEGTLLDELRKIQSIFFDDTEDSDIERLDKMIDEYLMLLKKSDVEISKSLYKVKATFAVVKPTHYNKVINFVNEEIEKINWYRDHKYHDIQQAICEYIVASSCFNFGLDPIITDIFHVFWHSLNYELFYDLGFKEEFYLVTSKKLNQTIIEEDINKIIANNKATYPNLVFHTKNLNYKTKHDFATSFLYEFINCNFD